MAAEATEQAQQAAEQTAGQQNSAEQAVIEQGKQPEQKVAEAATAATEQPAVDKPVPDWKDRRIAQQTARVHELTKQLEAARASTQVEPASEPKPGETSAQFEARVQEETSRRTAANDFNRQCEDAATKGREYFPDFNDKITGLTSLVDRNDPSQVQVYNTFLAAALETGEAPRVLHALGADKNEASRIMALPPLKMAVELTKLANKLPAIEPGKPVPSITGAPKPITPVASRSGPHTEIDPTDPTRADNLSTAEWMRRREAQMSRQQGKA